MAVVGNVGTYATVQPIEGPNFGGMVQNQFDKLDAERKAKAKAEEEAKAKKQAQLDKISLGDKKISNITELENQTNEDLKVLKQEFIDAYNSGDMQGMNRAKDQLSTINNAIEFTNRKSEQIEKNRENLNQNYYNQFWALTGSINEAKVDRKYDKETKEHRITIYEDEEKTIPIVVDKTIPELLKSYEIPTKYTPEMLTNTAKNFAKTYRPDFLENIINSGDLYGVKGAETILNDERVEDELRSKAKQMSKDVGARALYASDNGISLFDFYKMDKDQIKGAEDFFYKELKNAYRDEIEYSISQKSKRGGSGKDGMKVGMPTLWDSSTINIEEPGSAPGRTSIKKVPVTAGKAKTTTISNSTGKTLLVNSMPLDRVLYDPDTGQMYIGIAFNASSRESMGNNGSGASEGSSNKVTKWFPSNSSEFNAFKTVYNSSFGTDLQTIDDFKRALFIDRGI